MTLPAASEVHARVRRAFAAIAAGEMVVVTDSPDRENEADLIMAADAVSPAALATMIRHGSGIVCVALPAERVTALQLVPMVSESSDRNGTAFTVSVDAQDTTTGVSASDRARTIAALAHPASAPSDFCRPGHVFPLAARDGGVLTRVGHTEAALDLARLAGRVPAGVLCELMNGDGTMMRGRQARAFAAARSLPVMSVEDLVAYRMATETLVELVATTRMPTRFGEFTAHVFRSTVDGGEHLALTMGDVRAPEPVLARVHSECLTGDTLGSLRCDCGDQLGMALRRIAEARRGALVYLRGHEGRGVGLAEKLRAYALQDRGADTVEANLLLGLPVDDRDYRVGAQILVELGARRLRLLTNNPDKFTGLDGSGLAVVDRMPLVTRPRPQNVAYLWTKQQRLGHLLALEHGVRTEHVAAETAEVCWP